jgi:hypothetical protein
MRHTKRLQEKLEDLLRTAGYSVRYERGKFRGGACLLDHERVVVINKFTPPDGRVGQLAEMAAAADYSQVQLTPQQRQFVKQLQRELSTSLTNRTLFVGVNLDGTPDAAPEPVEAANENNEAETSPEISPET